jgi:hypothetical protein
MTRNATASMAEISATYFQYREAERSKRGDVEALFWAWEHVDRAVRRSPELGIPIVMQLIDDAPDDSALMYVAAGPLEDLLCKHGELVAPELPSLAIDHPRLVQALRGVWGRQRMKASVVEVIDRLLRQS